MCIEGSVSCVIHPLPLSKIHQSYIARILWLLYFLIFLKVIQLRQNARYIYQLTNSCYWIPPILNTSWSRQVKNVWKNWQTVLCLVWSGITPGDNVTIIRQLWLWSLKRWSGFVNILLWIWISYCCRGLLQGYYLSCVRKYWYFNATK